MAFCSNCGAKLGDGAKFCANCGVGVGIHVENVNERKVFYDGEIHKCPSCGEVLNSFIGNCPACGYELRGVKVVSSVQRLAEQLAEIEKKRDTQDWKSFFRGALKGKKLEPVDEEKIDLIQNFPIPTTKEDIRDLLILAEGNMEIIPHGSEKEKEAQRAVADAWKVKYNQARKKAKILFKNTTELEELGCVKERKGWRTWHPLLQIVWVGINIYLLGIPALIYVIFFRK